MKWTTDRPKTEGWYWITAHFMDTAIMHTSEIAKIFKQVRQARTDPAVKFAGPIPLPDSPEAALDGQKGEQGNG